YFGVADRSRLRRLPCAQRAITPERATARRVASAASIYWPYLRTEIDRLCVSIVPPRRHGGAGLDASAAAASPSEDSPPLDEALTRLTAHDPVKVEAIQLPSSPSGPCQNALGRRASRWQPLSPTGLTTVCGSTPS